MKTAFTCPEETGYEVKFIDREKEREVFWDIFDARCEREEQWTVTVFHFWGMGGIGKSALLKKLLLEAEERNGRENDKISTAYVSVGEQDNGIRIMSRIAALLKRNCHFSFPLFEIGLYALAVKSGAGAIKKEVETLQERSGLLSMLLDGADLVQPLSFAATVFRLLDQCAKEIKTHVNGHKKSVEELERLMPEELTEKLPDLFLKDMISNNDKVLYPILIFLDKLEALRTGISGIDEIDYQIGWLKYLTARTPNVIWVCSGREKLLWAEESENEWEESLYTIEVKPFDEIWMSRYFADNDMEVATIRRELYELTQGIPLFLTICYELYQKLCMKTNDGGSASGKSLAVTIKSFEGKQERLIQTYVENLTLAERRTLFVLACVGEWDGKLIHYLTEKVPIDSFREAYRILMRKSYLAENGGGFELHQVIQEQVFAFCKEDIIADTADLLWDYLPKDRFSWGYPKFLRCRLRCIKNDKEADEWWISREAEPLKQLIQSNNINGFEACYKEILKQTEGRLSDSVISVVCGVYHIRNLLRLNCCRQAQKEANRMLRICKSSEKMKYLEFHGIMSEYLELKAQALDGQKKYEQAFCIREKLCRDTDTGNEENRFARLHNLASSYQHLRNYRMALELTEKIIEYRRLHREQMPEDYVRALFLKGIILNESYKNHFENKELIPQILEALETALGEANRLLAEDNMLTIDMEISYADMMSDLYFWEEALKSYTSARKKLFQINQGRNRQIDVLDYRIAIAMSETGNSAEALGLLDELQKISGEYEDDSEHFSFRCMLEKGNSLSIDGRHEEAREILLDAYERAKEAFGSQETIVLKFAYAAAVEDYFLERYKECLSRLDELYPQIAKQCGKNSAFVFMLKKQRIRCLEKMEKQREYP